MALSDLVRLTGGLVGDRDPAQPLLTLHDGGGRVELSGATTANWVSKTANLLVDGLGTPQRVGVLLPLHWQAVVAVLACAAAGVPVRVVADPGELQGCDAALVLAPHAEAALDAGVDEVLALSGHPLGAPCGPLPPLVQDFAREVPSYGDRFSGRPALDVDPAPDLLEVAPEDRVLTALPPATPEGLGALLGPLRSGAALVLVPDAARPDLAALAAAERVTATAGVDVAGVPRLR